METKEKCEICSRSLEEHEGKELADCNRKLWQMHKAAPAMYEALKALLAGNELDPQNPNRVVCRAAPSSEAILQAFKSLALAEGRTP